MKQIIRCFYFDKQKEQIVMMTSQKVFALEHSPSQEVRSACPTHQLKAQIDSILENDFAVLADNPNANHNSLLSKHNNPLLLTYIRQIYHEYNIKDPLPKHYFLRVKSEAEAEAQLNTSIKKKSKIHLYSSQVPSKYATPIRQQRNSPSQQIKTQPTKKLLTLGPASNTRDLISNELTMKKEIIQNDTTLKASNSYFQNKSAEPSYAFAYNEPSTFYDPEKLNLSVSRKYEKGKQMRIEDEEPFQNIDEGIQIQTVTIPFNPSIPAEFIKEHSRVDRNLKWNETEARTLPLNDSVIQKNQQSPQFLQIQGADIAHSRLVMPYPLPEIIKANVSRQQREVKESFRYCIGCEKALLDVNIHIHQKKCSEFQRVLSLSSPEIIEHLKSKISSFERNIQYYSQELLKIDPNNLGQHSQKMLAESRQILGEGRLTQTYQREYGQIMQISRKWCLMTEEINKVNWFLKIRERVKKQLQV